MAEVVVRNAGSGAIIAGGRILYPGESRALHVSVVDALNQQHGAGTLVPVGAGAAAEPVATVDEAGPGAGEESKKGKGGKSKTGDGE